MKNLIIRTVIALALLLTLGAFFGGVSAPSAHAAAAAVTPDINSVYCTGSNQIAIYLTAGGPFCFANAGYTPATFTNVVEACSFGLVGYVTGISGTHYGLSPQSCNDLSGEPIIAVEIDY